MMPQVPFGNQCQNELPKSATAHTPRASKNKSYFLKDGKVARKAASCALRDQRSPKAATAPGMHFILTEATL